MRGREVIFGIDFSGAKDAGNKIWIAKGSAGVEAVLGDVGDFDE